MFSIRSSPYCAVIICVCGLLVATVPVIATADVLVTGRVSVDGKPLAAGSITFHQRDGQFVGGPVKNGLYNIDRVPAGPSIVTIEGKGVALQFTSRGPSCLDVRIVNDGDNNCDFELAGVDHGALLPEDDPLLQAIVKRFGEPDHVKINGRFRIRYCLRNGDALTLIISDGKVIDIEHFRNE